VKSIQSRLFIGVSLVLSVLLVGQWLWISSSINRFIETQISAELEQEAESILANIDQLATEVVLNQTALRDSYERPFSGLYYRVDSASMMWLSRSLWDFTLAKPNLTLGERQIWFNTGPSQQELMLLSRQYQKLGDTYTITVAKDISMVLAEKADLQQMLLLFSVLGLVGFITVQTGLITNALMPLSRVKRQLKQLEQGEIGHLDEQAPNEIKPLLRELNHLIKGVTEKTTRSRQALGNLAHSLKTQLALLSQAAESKGTDTGLIQQRIDQHVGSIKQIIDRELKRARLVGLAIPGKTVLIKEIMTDLTQTLALIYQDKEIEINLEIDGSPKVKMDREDITELLGNVLDNASKWCKKQVDVQVKVDNEIKIVIEDDGVGCDLNDLSQLTQRGYRVDETVSGSGLGLAIAQDILEHYQGRMTFQHSDKLKGLQVTIYLQAFVTD
jgi:signal transduction histidine kinase